METRNSPSVDKLHKMANEQGIEHYQSLGKTELFHLVVSSPSSAVAERDMVDPIMLEPLGENIVSLKLL